MSITPISGTSVQGSDLRRTEQARGSDGRVTAPGPVGRAERADRVDISSEGRAQALEDARRNALPAARGSDRLDEIRARIEAGTYDTPEVAEEVARKLLASGDLDL
jgi:anti-sigma28 factor (negative regulator of flagellin synthesis)